MIIFFLLLLLSSFCLPQDNSTTVQSSSTVSSTISTSVVPVDQSNSSNVTLSSTNLSTTTVSSAMVDHYSKRKGLMCYGSSGSVKYCEGICVAKLYFSNGKHANEIGCQHQHNATNENTKIKCPDLSDLKPRFMRYTMKIRDHKKWKYHDPSFFDVKNGDVVTVFKKCCYTDDCNQMVIFQSDIMGMMKQRVSEKVEKGKRTDTHVISFLVITVIFFLVIYSVWKAWRSFEKEKERSPDYQQRLHPILVHAALQDAVEEGPEVRGELSLKETAAVLMVMMFPPKQDSQSTSSSDTCVAILPPQIMQAVGNGHTLVRTIRTRPFFLQSILFRMLEHGPYYFPFRPMELLELFDEATEVFQAQRSLVFVSSCVIIGDLRGSYSDLWRWLQAVGWPPKTRLLFLGNVLDQDEPGSLETIALIAALKIAFPTEVFMLRGQTETFPFKPEGRFPSRTGNAIGRCIMRMCSFLPMSAIVMERILAVPSGVTPLVAGNKDLLDLPRPATLETLSDTQRHLLFNQPSPNVRMYRKNKDSRGDFFGSSAVERIRSDLSVNMIVRGGAPVPEGYCPCWDHTLVSLWSTASKGSDKGAILLVSPDLEVTPVKMLRQTVPVISSNGRAPGESTGILVKAGSAGGSPLINSAGGSTPSGQSNGDEIK